MKVTVLYFGIVRERLGLTGEVVEVPDGGSVGELVSSLAARHSLFALGAGSIRVAVNREYVDNEHRLSSGDEIAIIPPVAGGSGERRVSYR